MKKLYYLIVLTLILGLVLTGCLLSNVGQVPTTGQSGITYLTKGGPTENEADEYTLYAGQDIPVGTVNVWNDAVNLYVQYVVDDPWEMTGSHLYVGKTDPSFDFPSTPGQFPYSPSMAKSPSPSALYDDATMTYTIPLDEIYDYEFVGKGQGKGLNAIGTPGVEPCDEIYIAAQAEVFRSYELVNPGAEDGMNGWNYTSGVVRAIESRVESTGIVLPRSGGYFFDMSERAATLAEMSQGVNVAGFDGTSFNASGWIQTEWYPEGSDDSITANDYGRLVVTFYDNSNDELESFTTVPIGNPVYGIGSDGYAQFSLEGNIPEGAVTAIYELHGTLVPLGSFLNVFYDDLSFEYWQEETAWAEGDNFGKNWATYFTYHIAGVPPTISSLDLAGPFTEGVLGEFHVKTVNPECGFAYSNVLFNYTIFDINLSDIANFEYFDGTNWGTMPMSQSGSNVEGFFGPWPDGFPMTVPYSVETTFRINITTPSTYEVIMTLNDLNNSNAELAILTEDVVVSPGTVLEIGDSYGGGKVAYFFQDNGTDPDDPGYVEGEQHGLIAATADQSTGIRWFYGSYVATGVTGTTIGTGQANTTAIVNIQGAGSYAAQLCDDLTVGGYNNWFLPSKDELNKLYLNKGTIGGFADYPYWSSSEVNASLAWYQYFSGGYQYYGSKYLYLRVRAVRAF